LRVVTWVAVGSAAVSISDMTAEAVLVGALEAAAAATASAAATVAMAVAEG